MVIALDVEDHACRRAGRGLVYRERVVRDRLDEHSGMVALGLEPLAANRRVE
jgi:hypothetical protein